MAARHIIAKQGGLSYEDEIAFGVTPAGTGTRLHRAENIVFKPALNMIPVEAKKTGDMLGVEPFIVGGYGGELTFDLPLHTMGGAESPVTALLQSCGMKVVSVAADATGIIAGSAAGTLVMLEGDIGNIVVGSGILHDSAAGTDSLRYVERVEVDTPTATDTTLHMNANWATTPAASDGWAAMDTLMPSSDIPTTLSFHVFHGSGATDILEMELGGCAGTAVIPATEAGALPKVSFTFMVDRWDPTEATLAQTAFAGNEAAPLLGDSFLMDGTDVATKSIGFNPGLEIVALNAVSGTNGRAGYKHVDSIAKLEILPRHDVDLLTKLEAGTVFDGMFSSVQSLTDAWGLWIPAAQILSYENGDVDGLLRPTMDIQATDLGMNADDTQIPQWAISITK